MFRTLVDERAIDGGSIRCAISSCAHCAAPPLQREILLAPGDRIILDDDR